MLIGGMFGLDIEKAMQEPEKKEFPLRCDVDKKYGRYMLTNNGRTAAAYAMQHGVRLPKNQKVMLPEYNCISVINAFEAVGADLVFYKVKPGLVIDMEDLKEKIGADCGLIYVIHYFGVPQPEHIISQLVELAEQYHAYIMEDLTQALFTRGKGRIGFGHYLVASVRKWFPITDGGIAAARDDAPFEVEALEPAYDEAVYKQMFLSLVRKEYEQHTDRQLPDYLMVEKAANQARYLDFTPKGMTQFSENILFQSDFASCMRARRNNYDILYGLLKESRDIALYGEPMDQEGNYVPFGLVIEAEDRDGLYRYLVQKGIVGEIQWPLPGAYYHPGQYALYMSRHSLMLQCDQRYGRQDMEIVAKAIHDYRTGRP